MSIKLDWEMSEAPRDNGAAAEPPSPARAKLAPPPYPAHQLFPNLPAAAGRGGPRRILPLLLVLALAGAGGASLWYVTRSGWQRVMADIDALVRYEDEQTAAGNDSLVLNVQAAGNRDWLEVRQAELARDLAAPLPVPMLAASGTAPAVDTVTAIDAGFVTATVRRSFVTPDGRRLAFTLQQIYQRDGLDDWQRTAPPGHFWGRWEDWQTPYLHVRYSERDAVFVAAVAPHIERRLQEACGRWATGCAGALPARLYLSGYVGSLEYDPLSNIEVRVEFGDGEGARPPEYFLSIASPQIAGMPVEPAAEAYLAEYLAVRLIASLAARSTFEQAEADQMAAHAIQALDLRQADPGLVARAALRQPITASALPPPLVPERAHRPFPVQAWVNYTIEPGDTLVTIANRFDITVAAIVRSNAIPNPDLIVAGITLQIPVEAAVSSPAPVPEQAPPVATPSP